MAIDSLKIDAAGKRVRIEQKQSAVALAGRRLPREIELEVCLWLGIDDLGCLPLPRMPRAISFSNLSTIASKSRSAMMNCRQSVVNALCA